MSLCFYYERFSRNHSCILEPDVWDFSKLLPDDRFPGSILNALFGYTQRLYVVQAIAYLISVDGRWYLFSKPRRANFFCKSLDAKSIQRFQF